MSDEAEIGRLRDAYGQGIPIYDEDTDFTDTMRELTGHLDTGRADNDD